MTRINMSIKVLENCTAKDSKAVIVRYVRNLPIPEKYKLEILSPSFIDVVRPIYTHYPSLFSKAFEVNVHVELLNIASYLFHNSVIWLDKILDGQSAHSEKLFLATICHEEAIKILASIYPLEAEFWISWSQRRKEYLIAYQIDKGFYSINSYDEFETLADYKSAFGKIAIDCMYLLSDARNKELHVSLHQSHKYYYCALQILDDINDLREDILNTQFNICLFELKSFLQKRSILHNSWSTEDLVKSFFILGIAEKMFNTALNYLDKAIAAVPILDSLTDWRTELSRLNNIIVTKQLNLQAYILQQKVELRLSNEVAPKRSLDDSLISALGFVIKFQNADGSFNEYFNEAGMSDVWATSFISSFLAQTLRLESDERVVACLEKACNFILNSRTGGLWGYNKEWIPDADSSSFAQLALLLSKGRSFKNSSSFFKWLAFQREDGGFSTYKSQNDVLSSLNWSENTHSVDGWLQSHTCVTSVALYLIVLSGNEGNHKGLLFNYLRNIAKGNSLWDAYWWTSGIYTNCFLIKSIHYVDDFELKCQIEACIKPMLLMQNDDGSFGDSFNIGSPFYTALVIDAICDRREIYDANKAPIDRAVYWLLSNQLSDGSWKKTDAMRIPTPDVSADGQEQWVAKTHGLNTRAREFCRLFTTSVSYSALKKYQDVTA